MTLRKYRSLIVFDPKGELTAITAHSRKSYGDVYVLNPFGILPDEMKGLKQVRYNAMTALDPSSIGFHSACEAIADGFRSPNAGPNDSHWDNNARMIISATIAVLKKYGRRGEQNLVAVRNVITGANGESFYDFCRVCMELDDPFIKQKLARFAVPNAETLKELSSIISTGITNLDIVGNEAIANSLMGDDFTFRELKRKRGSSVYCVLPLNRLSVCSDYYRLFAAGMLSELLDEGMNKKSSSVLAVVDEAFQLGQMKALTDCWGMFDNIGHKCAWCGDNGLCYCKPFCGALVCSGLSIGRTFHCRKSCGASWVGQPMTAVPASSETSPRSSEWCCLFC
jgi:type IV secretion system protein VirD4